MVFEAIITHVHDGDTVKALCDLGFNIKHEIWLRLKDVWAPELNEKDGIKARNELIDKYLGKKVLIRTFKTEGGNYKRSFIRYIASIVSVYP